MTHSRIVVALGGNALGKTPEEQKKAIGVVAEQLVELMRLGHDLVIGHGNGPQVGAINLAFDLGHQTEGDIPLMPFAESNAMSQGYIGYHMQQVLQNAINAAGLDRRVASVVTQVEVDSNDPAFQHPTKPIGLFYSKDEADSLRDAHSWDFIEDSGRGYRRVVPSPLPKNIVELETVKTLVDNGTIVITIGGGGIPVIEKDGNLSGVDAVIDKDESSAQIATQLNADVLLLLTGVDHVFINFGTPEQQQLNTITPEQAREYLAQGQFGTGSMKPKIEASLRFVEAVPHGRAIISSIENAVKAVEDGDGTVITNAPVAAGHN